MGYSDGHDSELVKLSKNSVGNHNTLPGEAFFLQCDDFSDEAGQRFRKYQENAPKNHMVHLDI